MPDLPNPTQAIIDTLVKRGGVHEQLDGTNAHTVNYAGKDLYFLGEFNPVVPFIYGVFTAGHDYVEVILREAKQPFSRRHDSQPGFRVLITSSGYTCVLQGAPSHEAKVGYKDVTVTAHASVGELAQRMLGLFPGVGYLSFDCSGDSVATDAISKYTVTDVSFSLDSFMSFQLHRGNESTDTTEVIADLITA